MEKDYKIAIIGLGYVGLPLAIAFSKFYNVEYLYVNHIQNKNFSETINEINGFIKSTFFEFKKSKKYEFISGPFTNMIFNILQENKLSIKARIGNYIATVTKDKNLFRPV